MLELTHFVGGKSYTANGAEFFDDLNPLDDSLYARVVRGTPADVAKTVEAATAAFPAMRDSLPQDRERWLCKAADILERDAEQFADALIDEIGSPIRKAQFEIGFSTGFLRAAAGVPRRVRGETIPSEAPGRISMSLRQPVGVVAGITPFNVPLIKAIKQSAMALATGNSFVLLPSEYAPHIGSLVGELWREAGVPEGAFNIVYGIGAEIGDSLVSHSDVRAITFTGSSRVGKHLAQLAARDLKKYTLELGGKSPFVVFADADINKAVQAAVFGMFLYQGQVCMGSSRIFLAPEIYDEFREKYARAAASLKGGDLRSEDTVLGPIISERQRERVRTHIANAVEHGGAIITGGEWSGHSCSATIFENVTAPMLLRQEETFGPVTTLYTFDGLDDAIEKANDTNYGLSAAVFTQDVDKAMTFASRVHAGMVHINAATLHDEAHVPFGGVKDSGFGREGTEADLEIMTEWKWVTMQLGAAVH